MKYNKKVFRTISVILLGLILLSGCKVKMENYSYDYLVIHEEDNTEPIIMSLYNKNGDLLEEKELNYKALTGPGFRRGIRENSKAIYQVSDSPEWKSRYMLEINKTTLETKKIKTGENSGATAFIVDEKYAFMASGSTVSYISKSSLETGEFMDEIEVENHILQMAQDDKNLYLLTMKYLKDDGQASIKIVDKESFKVIDTVENIGKFMNSTDMLFLDDKIYVLKEHDENDKPANELIVVDLKTKKSNIIKLPFMDINNILNYKNNLIVTQCALYDGSEDNENKVAIINLDNMEIKEIKLDITPRQSFIKNDKFITTDYNYINEYDANSFKKLSETKIDKFDKGLRGFYPSETK